MRVVVLAAGSGRRLGLGPKAHVLVGGVSLLARVVATCRTAGLRRVLVVGSAHDARIAPACATLGVELLANEAPDRGMASSVILGLAATARGRSAALIFPVDTPFVRPDTVAQIAAAVRGARDSWARPVHEKEGGHPIALGARVIARVVAAGHDAPLRQTLRALAVPRVDVVTDDTGVARDIDTLADLRMAEDTLRED
jgi:CTP:molybdopterin cytidylyltransferase MocA